MNIRALGIALTVSVLWTSNLGSDTPPNRPLPAPLVIRTQDGTEVRISAWDDGKEEAEWMREAQDYADLHETAVAITQSGQLIALLNPRPFDASNENEF